MLYLYDTSDWETPEVLHSLHFSVYFWPIFIKTPGTPQGLYYTVGNPEVPYTAGVGDAHSVHFSSYKHKLI